MRPEVDLPLQPRPDIGGVPLRVHAVQLPHALRQIGLGRLDHHMVMVGHLALRVTSPVESLADLLEALPPITPGSDVIKTTSQFDTKRTRHDIKLTAGTHEGETCVCAVNGCKT